VTASVAISRLVSLTLAPMLCARFLEGAINRAWTPSIAHRSWLSSATLSGYRRTLDVVLRHQFITLACFSRRWR
jgi:multidrug efflux pump subunit AcrB